MKIAGGVREMGDKAGVLEGTLDAQRTCGDGACALHSVFGVLDQSGEYFCKQARRLFCDSLGVEYSEFQSKVNARLLEDWEKRVAGH
eukprot:6522282-Karenia_brevis.AAC.1